MSRPLSLSRLKSMSPSKREELLSELVSDARGPANGTVDRLSARIAEYERRYELPSLEMVKQVQRGDIEETEDIASWLMLLKVRMRARDN
jgi:hypothetical protein